MFLDGILVMIALRIAIVIRPILSSWAEWIKDIGSPPALEPHLYLIFAAIWVIVFMLFSIYDPQKHLRVVEELNSLFWACLLVMIVIPGMLYFVEREMSRVLFVSFALIASVMLVSYRLVYRVAFQKGIIKTHENRRILIVGAGIVGRRIGDKIDDFKHLGFEIVGYVDDDHDLVNSQPDVLGNLDQTGSVIKDNNIQHLIIALPRRAHDRTNDLVSQVHKLPVRVWVIPDYFALALNQAAILEFAGFPLIDLRAPALSNYQRLIKRTFDLFIAVPIFILILPIMGLIAILIKLDSEGPAFYQSTRMKENGETFGMIKFRTMSKNADQKLKDVIQYDDEEHVIHKRPDDPRVTNIGKFLRKTSLDELPQLINIIKGDMSLVGPRPELPEMVALYEPWQRARFAVPQGLTGWWQVNGRSDKPMHLHTDEDLYYIQHYSIWLDLQIILKTILIVLKGKGAY
jgi:exopolysaccharide biosynthesis polyprenyl glycosylphosphotransferase